MTEQSVDPRVAAVAEHALFRKAPVLRELLLYLGQQPGREVSEYELATEVLERKADFDPKTDSTVRVQIGRLRQRLKEYREQADADGRFLLEIPLGSYQLQIREAPEPVEAAAHASSSRWLGWVCAGLGLCVLLLVADKFYWRSAPAATPALPRFWRGVLPEARPVQIVVPAPVFFRWEKEGLVARDFSINTPERLLESPRLAALRKQYGNPDLSQIYTVASDTLGAALLSRYLESHGVAVKVFDTPSLSVDSLEGQDAILLAGPGTTDQAKAYLPEPSFALEQGTGRLVNLHPREGEPTEWRDTTLAPQRINGYGILSLYPGRTAKTRLLVANSRYNLAVASLLTGEGGLARLGEELEKAGNPEFFESVIAYERNGDKILNVRPILLRAR